MPLKNFTGNKPGAIFFAAYDGPSMNPTLRGPEIMEIMPYGGRPLRVGDVALFLSPETEQLVVHRVVRVSPAGISTLGDNNTQEDNFILTPERVQGQVVAAWRGQKRRRIGGGSLGRLANLWCRCRRALDRGVSLLLHPSYQTLSHWRGLTRLLPAPLRPRVVAFKAQGRDRFQLLLGQRTIGRYDDQRNQWQIKRPFQLIVDGKMLQGQRDKGRPNHHALSEQPAQNHMLTQEVKYDLVLGDGTNWVISAGTEEAASIVAQLGSAMRLNVTTNVGMSSHKDKICRLLVQVDAHSSVADCYVPLASQRQGVVVCILSPSDHWGGPFVNLVRLSLVLAREAQARGGVLIHGALAEWHGIGVILAAPGGTGKTTASNRLPAHWRSLCDDTTLVVRDPQGNYWAHPWPTWSRFQDAGPGGAWDVQRAVPVKGIYILDQAAEDRAERLGPGQAVSLIGECVRQASMFMCPGLTKEELHALHMEQFNNLCALAKVIPAHLLHLSMTGTFWQKIEQVLENSHSVELWETRRDDESESKSQISA